MTVTTIPAAVLPRALKSTAMALTLGLAALGLLFWEEVGAAVRVWIDSTAYNHCFLVLPIVAYLIWERRASLVGVPIRPVPAVALAALPLTAAWLIAERLGIMEGRQLVLMALVELLLLGILGWRMFGRLAAPFLYLFFLVPFGAFLVPWLQNFTAKFIDFGLGLTSLPYFIDNYVIEIPEGTFYVAEACAGLRFLIASVAFGVLYAVLIYRSWTRRAIFVAVSIAVPIVANGLRALGIVWLGHVLGSAQAAAADHVVYGWVFFSVVILLLVALGLPFRQDLGVASQPATRQRPVAPSLAPPLGPSLGAAALVTSFAVLGPLAAGWLDRAAASEPVRTAPIRLAGCEPDGASPAAAVGSGVSVQRLSCDGGAIRVVVAAFAPRTGPSDILAEQRRSVGQVGGAEVELSRLRVPGSEVPWQLAQTHEPPPSAAATALWIDGRPTGGGLAMRLRQAANSLRGGTSPPVVVTATLMFDVATPGTTRDWPEQALQSFLARHPSLPAEIERLSAGSVSSRQEPG